MHTKTKTIFMMSGETRLPAELVISTTLALIEQFEANLGLTAQEDVPPTRADAPSPLLLLSASAKTLKAQVTKLSLLTVIAPFTPSAIATSLQSVNDSVLPSLVTATLLATSAIYTSTFVHECKLLTRGTLRDLQVLIKLVEARSRDGKPKEDISNLKKKDITEATGKIWEDCDDLVKFAEEGVPGFTVRKAKQWLELMKDAVKELQEWDPEDELDENDPFGQASSDEEQFVAAQHTVTESDKADDRATISAGVKDQALKVLSRIPQSIHVVLKQRLEKTKFTPGVTLSRQTRSQLDRILIKTRTVSELIDESAEGMYLGDLELCLKKAGEARAVTIEIVESVLEPFEFIPGNMSQTEESKEDKYIKRALEWVRQVDEAKDLPRR